MFDFTNASLEQCAEAFAGLAPSPSQRAALVRDPPRERLNLVGASLLAILGFGTAPMQPGRP